jgi:hypothetical protein
MSAPRSAPLVVASPTDDVRALVAALAGEPLWLPDLPPDAGWGRTAEFEIWREENSRGAHPDSVVVAVGTGELHPAPAKELETSAWTARAEMPLAAWAAALAVGVERVAAGGALVAVVDQPAPLDSVGWAPEAAVADAVEALVRSLARSEGATRRVRVNLVTSPRRFEPGAVSPTPPLDTFPGTTEEVAGAVRTLLDPDAGLVTGAVVHADAGRDYR